MWSGYDGCGYMMLNRLRRIGSTRTKSRSIHSWSLRRVPSATSRAREKISRRHNRKLPPPHYRARPMHCICSPSHVFAKGRIYLLSVALTLTRPVFNIWSTLANGDCEQDHKFPDILPRFLENINLCYLDGQIYIYC